MTDERKALVQSKDKAEGKCNVTYPILFEQLVAFATLGVIKQYDAAHPEEEPK